VGCTTENKSSTPAGGAEGTEEARGESAQEVSRIGVERVIPIRFASLVPDCTAQCDPAKICSGDAGCAAATACAPAVLQLANLQAHTQSLNQTYSVAGIQFTIQGVDQYAMPGIAGAPLTAGSNQSTQFTWAQVRSGLRQALPGIPCTTPPNLPTMSPTMGTLTLSQWVVWASVYYAPTSSIPAWSWSGFPNGFGVYPWRGRSIIWRPDLLNTVTETNYAHEIGHFLGLPHAFDGAVAFGAGTFGGGGYNIQRNQVRDPSTGNYLDFSDFWDLVYLPRGGPSNDVFYNTKSAVAIADEPSLFAKQTYDTPSAGLTTCSISNVCTMTCSMNDGNFTTDNPQLRSNSFIYQGDNPAGGVYKRSVNVMGYQEDPSCQPGSLSGSQIAQLRRTLRDDIAIEDINMPSATGQRQLLGQSVGVARPALYKLDFDNDGKRDAAVFEPPSTVGGTGNFKALLSPSFTTTYNRSFGTLGDVPVPADYDGDGHTDYAVWRQFGPNGTDPTNLYAYWIYCPQTAANCTSPTSIQFGYNTDIPLPGTDFDGNPATGEIAVFRPSDGYVYWRYTTMAGGGSIYTGYGGGTGLGKIPLLDKYDPNATTDVALYDPSTATFTLVYTGSSTIHTYSFPSTLIASGTGTVANRSGGVVSQGAYDTVTFCSMFCTTYQIRSFQVWSPDDGAWYTMTPYKSTSISSCGFGGPGDIPVSGFIDKDGNGKSDYVVYRARGTNGNIDPPTTYFRHDDCTTDTANNVSLDLNARSIVSASGDFNADGQSDIIYLDKDTMTWTVLRSSTYTSTYNFQLGAIGASPL
jgi:hypothetical protein